jgi:dTMP kinase
MGRVKIYFAASTSSGRKFLKQSQRIVEYCKKLGHRVLSEHIVDPTLQDKKEWMKKWDADKVYRNERQKVKQCDAMITEVSAPSWGVGLLTEYALSLGKPVLALFFEPSGTSPSLMIQGNPDLFVENYNWDNLKSLLDHYLKFFKKQQRRKGKLIVIDGTDGSGKATQSKLLAESLRRLGKTVRRIEFPRYYTSFHGAIVGRFLKGEFGEINQVSPYLISLAYALDRLTARKQIQDWLEAGDYVIADRYTSANMAHQTAKVPPKQRAEFLRWIEEMEYKHHKIPREDIVLFLYVPVEISQKLVDAKQQRGYVKGKKRDIAEASQKHQGEALKVYLELANTKKHWAKIDCVNRQSQMKSRPQIQREILAVLKRKKII